MTFVSFVRSMLFILKITLLCGIGVLMTAMLWGAIFFIVKSSYAALAALALAEPTS